MTDAVIGIARALRFDIIAEGVESERQRTFLVEHGCIAGQGFLFSAGVSADEFAKMLGTSAAFPRVRVLRVAGNTPANQA